MVQAAVGGDTRQAHHLVAAQVELQHSENYGQAPLYTATSYKRGRGGLAGVIANIGTQRMTRDQDRRFCGSPVILSDQAYRR
jgi:hypothetical protein